MRHWKDWTIAGVVVLAGMAWASEVQAQRQIRPVETKGAYFVAPPQVIGVPKAAPAHKMTFDIVYDDGEADVGYGFNNTASLYDIVQRFDLPAVPLQIDSLEICLFREGSQDTLDFEFTIWDASGANGSPGVLLDVIEATAPGLPPGGVPTFLTYDLTGEAPVVEQSTVYIGIGWSPDVSEEFFLCGDYDRDTLQPGYDQINLDQNWTAIETFDAQYTALMVRGSFSPLDSSSCAPDAQTLCLNNGRFQVRTEFRTPQGQVGTGQGIQLTNDTGYFWFFNQDNVEMVIKVLDACSFADRFWVFAGGLTNVEVTMTVTDTATGAVNTYINPLGQPFQPIQDTEAFSTCP